MFRPISPGCSILVTEPDGERLQFFRNRWDLDFEVCSELGIWGLQREMLRLELGVYLGIWLFLFVTRLPPPASLRVVWMRFGHG